MRRRFAFEMCALQVVLGGLRLAGAAPIHEAAGRGDLSVVSNLLKQDPALVRALDDKFKATPLLWAAAYGKQEVVLLLLANGADVNARNGRGQSALHQATMTGQVAVVEVLLDKGAEVNVTDDDSNTPLHFAASQGSKTIVELLIARKANPKLINKDGLTAKAWAVKQGKREVAALLEDLEIEPDTSASPTTPPDLQWSQPIRDHLNKVAAAYPKDPIQACMAYQAILGDKKTPLSPRQKAWLKGALALSRRDAMALLEQDFEQAMERRDVRGAFVANWVAATVQEGGLGLEKAAHLAALLAGILRGDDPPQPVWEITDAKAKTVPSPYVEAEGSIHIGGRSTTTVAAAEGCELWRVWARVRNVSDTADPLYMEYVRTAVERALAAFQSPTGVSVGQGSLVPRPGGMEEQRKPVRLAKDCFVFLATQEGKLLPCGFIFGGPELRGLRIGAPGYGPHGRVLFTGSYVPQGAEFDLDFLASVPAGSRDVQLMMIGGRPVPVTKE